MIDNVIEAGRVNRLEIYKDTDFGFFLRSANEQEVLLPNAYVTKDMNIYDEIDVFIYHDSEDRLIATTKRPYAMEGEYFYGEVVDYQRYGAFIDWGLPKDLFVPLSQQKAYFNVGKKFILRVCLDRETGRLYGTHKIGKHIIRDMKGLHNNKEMEIIVIAKTPLGYKVIADSKYEGMLFDNEIFSDIKIGEKYRAYIKKVRVDFKLDMSLQPLSNNDYAEDKILEVLRENNNILEVTSKSSPEVIKELFGVSKKSFKKALNTLIESKSIKLEDGFIKI
ncbi:hypothetical protein MNB_SV-15-995 [hydrothermal vent metagenome]|uniref:S1 motif domain-containing protein n=1 Tax=hydrothermal vent metagenome TaxID=652676 RepID=A0A1W1EIT1_9ZZZZ